jgi:hypothetical protein
MTIPPLGAKGQGIYPDGKSIRGFNMRRRIRNMKKHRNKPMPNGRGRNQEE